MKVFLKLLCLPGLFVFCLLSLPLMMVDHDGVMDAYSWFVED